MGVTSWDVSDLHAAGDGFLDAAEQIAVIGSDLTPLDPGAYGRFVGSAAAQTEPATSTANSHLMRAMGKLTRDVGAELRITAELYADAEADAVDLVKQLRAFMGEE